jgi:hypothetical protein
MKEINLEDTIRNKFHLSEENVVSNAFILNNPDVLWLENEIDYMAYVPSYVLWCIKNKDIDGNLIFDHTIKALAEFGRAKDTNNRLNFKFLCNDEQKELIYNFLNWCLTNLLCNKAHVIRAIKNWH